MEEGEVVFEEGEVAVGQDSQSARLAVPSLPESPEYNGLLPQRKPKKAKVAKAVAAGYYDVYGSQARAEVQLHSSRAIRPLDVQGLLLWVLADGTNPAWCFVKNKALVSKVVLVGMPGLDAELFMSKKELMPTMSAQLGTPATVLAKSAQVKTGSTLATLFTVPHSKKRKRSSDQQQQRQQQLPHQELGIGKQNPFPPAYYTMTLEQMEANQYPLPVVSDEGNMTCPPGFVATQPAGLKGALDMVSVDCEMCTTSQGFELTRASLIDSEGQVLLDELVLPENAITDYNTQYSGITQQALASITTNLGDIQKRMCDFLSAETMLVGHGLENDLRALKIIHANCLDTAVLYPHPKLKNLVAQGPPFKPALRILAERYLRRSIQQGEHDSVIDAQAALDLVKLKIAKGPAYGTFLQAEQGDKLMDVLHIHKRRCTLVDRTDMLNRHATAGANAIIATNDEEAVAKACKEIAKAGIDFVWTQVRSLGTFLGTRAAQKQQQQQQQQQQQFASNQQGQPVTAASNANTTSATVPNDTCASVLPSSDGVNPTAPKKTQATGQNTQNGSNAAVAGPTPSQPSGSTDHNGISEDNAVGPASLPVAPGQDCNVQKEEAVSTTEEHTESHQYVKTEHDASGNQQVKAEVLHKKTTTQVHKRKRQECYSGDGNMADTEADQPNADLSVASPLRPSASSDSTHGCSLEARDLTDENAAGPRDVGDKQLRKVLEGLDKHVEKLVDALPVNGLLIVFTCQGDTAEYRRMQEDRMRRQAGLYKLRPWTPADEAEMAPVASHVCRALCFPYVKQ